MTSSKVSTIERLTGSAAHLSASPAQRLKSFSADQSGNIGVIFGLTLMVTASVVGGAIDYGRAINARHQTQKALDAASLAGGRVLQVGGTATAAVAAADQAYAAQKSKFTVMDTVKFQPPTAGNTSIEASGGVTVATPFLSLVGIDKLSAIPDAATISGSCVGPTCGASGTGNTGTNIEISIMLDTTGSMCDMSGGNYLSPCTSAEKLDAMKTAAKDLIDIVVWADQTKFTSRVAIAPFANTVNVGKYFHAVTNQGAAGNDPTYYPILGYPSYSYPSDCYKSGRLKDSCKNNEQYGVGAPIYSTIAKPAAPCVVERIGAHEFTDVSPAGVGRAPQPGEALTSASVAASNPTMVPWNKATSSCGEATAIQPLTKDKVALKAAIDGMIGKNGTAGALGTAWAWYLISPEWGNVFTGDAKPAAYSKLTELDEAGKPKLRKIVILMTDGVYNTHQQGSGTTSIETKAKALCTAMKNKGITVYTIGFELDDQSAIQTLTDCASSNSIDTTSSVKNFYNASTPTALQAAFRDIALQISKLRLTR